MEKEINISIPEGYEIDKEKSTFTKIVFKKIDNKLPMSFEEVKIPYCWVIGNTIISKTTYNGHYTGKSFGMPIYTTEKYAKAFWALSKLIWLRDAWNEGWMPDYTDKTEKFMICTQYNMLITDTCYSYKFTMCFKTEKTRDDFFVQFKDLLETAKPLL